jgi:hypothetical protein
MKGCIVFFTLLVIILSCSQVQGYAKERISVVAFLNGDRFSPFDIIMLYITLQNNSQHDIALEKKIIFTNNTALSGTYIERSAGCEKKRRIWWLPGAPPPEFIGYFVLPAGKYIQWSVDLTTRVLTPSQADGFPWQCKIFIKVVSEISNANKEEYMEFAREHNADIFEGETTTEPVELVIERSSECVENRMFEIAERHENLPGDVKVVGLWNNFLESYEAKEFSKDHPFWDYWFIRRNRHQMELSWLASEPWRITLPADKYNFKVDKVKDGSGGSPTDFLDGLNEIERRQPGDKHFEMLFEEMLWRKCAVLYALGREAEADALKQDLMAKEPNRVFYFELKWLEQTAAALKERLESDKQILESERAEPAGELGKKDSSACEPETRKKSKSRAGSEQAHPAIPVVVGTDVQVPEEVQPGANADGSAGLAWFWLGVVGAAIVLGAVLVRRLGGRERFPSR